MGPSALQQTIGTVCAGLAGLLYLWPLQHLLWELRHKRDDGGSGALAGVIILGSLWLLLVLSG